jgi:hypothetical protein
MSDRSSQRGQTLVREIEGKPGQSIGNFVAPANGKITMKLSGDLLETKIVMAHSLEQREIQTRIQCIETIEMVEGRLWWLLWISVTIVTGSLGIDYFDGAWIVAIIPIIIFFVIKQKWLVVHNSSGNLVLFYKDSIKAKDFCNTLMALSRHLNQRALAPTPSNNSSQNKAAGHHQSQSVRQPQGSSKSMIAGI